MYFFCGLKLAPLKSDVFRFVDILEGLGQTGKLLFYKPMGQLVLSLIDWPETQQPGRLTGTVLNETDLMSLMTQTSLRASQYFYRSQVILAYYFDDTKLAGEMLSKIRPLWEDGRAVWLPPHVFFEGLVEASLYKSSSKGRHKRKSQRCLRKLQKYVSEGNVNCTHLGLLLKAELLSLSTKYEQSVLKAFDEGITCAGKLGFVHDQALGNELAGSYCLKHDDKPWARIYLNRSYELFQSWGAWAKTRHMEGKYGPLLDRSSHGLRHSTGHNARSRAEQLAPHLKASMSWVTDFAECSQSASEPHRY